MRSDEADNPGKTVSTGKTERLVVIELPCIVLQGRFVVIVELSDLLSNAGHLFVKSVPIALSANLHKPKARTTYRSCNRGAKFLALFLTGHTCTT